MNGSAFPHTTLPPKIGPQTTETNLGLSKREWIIGQVAAGLLSDPNFRGEPWDLAKQIVKVGDYLIKEMEKTNADIQQCAVVR